MTSLMDQLFQMERTTDMGLIWALMSGQHGARSLAVADGMDFILDSKGEKLYAFRKQCTRTA